MEETNNVPEQSQAVEKAHDTRLDIIIGGNADYSHLPLNERADLFQRWTEAQANPVPDDSLLNTEIVVVGMTVYQRDFMNPETGQIDLLTYVSFVFENGKGFRTASTQAIPFALQTAKMIGYDVQNGKLPVPIKMQIIPQKAETGFIYRFVFKGLAEEVKAAKAAK